MKINHLISLPKFTINNIEHKSENINIFASIKSRRSKCPVCGKFSTSVHDYYTRKIMDLSVFQNSTTIFLKTRKFKCKDPLCHRKVFSEQTPHVNRYSRKTVRANTILNKLSIELTGQMGSLLSGKLLLPVSPSTLIRMALKQEIPEVTPPTVLGVDDWAFRKGVHYGIILIDMETSRPIELLPSRESKDLKAWLKKYPEVKIVTRDRSGSYSAAINEGCPNSIQVADRFHLLMNLTEALDRYFKSVRPEIRSLLNKKDKIVPANEKINENVTPAHLESLAKNVEPLTDEILPSRIDQRIDTFNKVKELQAKGICIRRISRDLRICRNTVRSYIAQETLAPKNYSTSTNINSFDSHIFLRLNAPNCKVKDIITEIKSQGYNGGKTQAYHYINTFKSSLGDYSSYFTKVQQNSVPWIKPLSSGKMTKYIDQCLNEVPDLEARNCLNFLLENSPELRIVRKLVRIFKTMLRRGSGNIRRWINFIRGSNRRFAGLKTFANGLLHDIEAVENAISLAWSNGTVEGHVNRLKSIKRQMYGRAGFELLRRKVILSQTG